MGSDVRARLLRALGDEIVDRDARAGHRDLVRDRGTDTGPGASDEHRSAR